MTTFSVVCSVAERLDNLVSADGALVEDLREGVLQLRDLLENQLFLVEDEMQNFSGEVRQKVTQLVYDIEDGVESKLKPGGGGGGGAFQYLFKCGGARSLWKDLLHGFKGRIDELNHLIGVERDAVERSSSGINTTLSTVEQQFPNYAQIIVGMNKYRFELTSLLLLDEPKLSVIAICGMGGIGKTTLAKILYNDSLVDHHFDTRVWATLGENFKARDILESILFSLSPTLRKDEIAVMETMELMDHFHKAVKGKRYLVVLDDVWDSEAWDTIRFAFPDDHNGSRIVITTRLMSKAKDIATSVLQVQRLAEEQLWSIFRFRSGLNDTGVQPDEEIENIGRQITLHCKGHPFITSVIAGALRGKNLREWKEIDHKLVRVGLELPLDFSLALGYNLLSHHLKPCFLYMGCFPPNHPIPMQKLYLLWMAEGFISIRGSNDRAQMEVAEEYLNELVYRFMISSGNEFGSCLLHDQIRSLCLEKGEEEEFFQVINGHRDIIGTSARRIAISSSTNHDVLLNISHAKGIRSIVFFDADESLLKPTSSWPKEVSNLTKFQGTRVLDFDGVDFRVKKLPRGIQELSYLRHLSFQGCYLEKFPSSFSNFPFLETLDLRVRVSCFVTIPNILRKISSLRHLYFPLAFQGDTKEKLKLDTLKRLEILENFNAGLCDAEDLLQLQKLHTLTVVVDGNNLDLKNTIICMEKNEGLRHSSLVVKNFDSYSKERLLIVSALLKCNNLHHLDMEGYLGVALQGIGSNFTSMVFNGSEFSVDPMPILGKLPNLERLVLCNDAFAEDEMACSEGDFPQLASLKLATLHLLKSFTVDGAMQNLTSITIERCNQLKEVPYGLSNIRTLQEITIVSMPTEFKDQAREIVNWRVVVSIFDC